MTDMVDDDGIDLLSRLLCCLQQQKRALEEEQRVACLLALAQQTLELARGDGSSGCTSRTHTSHQSDSADSGCDACNVDDMNVVQEWTSHTSPARLLAESGILFTFTTLQHRTQERFAASSRRIGDATRILRRLAYRLKEECAKAREASVRYAVENELRSRTLLALRTLVTAQWSTSFWSTLTTAFSAALATMYVAPEEWTVRLRRSEQERAALLVLLRRPRCISLWRALCRDKWQRQQRVAWVD